MQRIPHPHEPATRPPPAWGRLSRGLGNRAIASALRPAGPQTAPPLPVQRAPVLDPKKVAVAAQQAKDADDAAAFWNLMRFLPAVPGLAGLSIALLQLAARAGVPVGVDGSGSPVVAHVIPGQVPEVAMVVAGVHGSEHSGVEVAERLLAQLSTQSPYYTVVVVPRLFPGNVADREAWEAKLAKDNTDIAVKKYQELRTKAGDVGRVTKGQEDPNRQFPDLGGDLDLKKPVDSKGRLIEPSNLALLALIDNFKPTRIVSIHAIKELGKAGVYADPHPASKATGATPQAVAADDLAIRMAKRGKGLGVNVRGNERDGSWTSLYPGQDPSVSAEQIKRENAKGRSLGQWGPSKGITVITVEVGEQYRSGSAVKDPNRAVELEGQATVIREIFLGPPPPAPVPVPSGSVPAQRMLVSRLAELAGNSAAASFVRRPRW